MEDVTYGGEKENIVHIGRDRMSECSAVVRLQVVHPVPAFFNFSKICIPRWLYGFMLV